MRKTIEALLITAVVLVGSVAILGGCVLKQFGQTPQNTAELEQLPYFHDGVFVSPVPTAYYPHKIEGGKGGMFRHVAPNPNRPHGRLPMERLNKKSFAEKPGTFAIYWLGHATLLIELEGKRILVDPVFGNAAPVPFVARRFSPPPLKRKDLPHIDYVLISHDHYDHLEYATIRYLRSRNTTFIVPHGVGDHLVKWGVPRERIRMLGWGDEYTQGDLTIAAENAVHFSGRTFSTRNASLWASYVIKGQDKRLFVSGDTGYSEHFREIGDRHGPFDVVFIEIDAWNPGWPKTHPFPHETIQAYHDLQAKALVPVHWAVFDLALHPWNRSITMIAELADKDGNVNLITPLKGQRLVPGISETTRWWEGLNIQAQDSLNKIKDTDSSNLYGR